MVEPLIYELSKPGRSGANLPALDVPAAALPEGVREHLPLPEVAEVDLVRHYVRLSQVNFGVDTGFYPLGSCTMKYNPKVNEVAARMPGFAQIHPLQGEESVQGAMRLMYELQEMLAEIAGFAAVSLQPAAGAQGELTGTLIMRKYLIDQGQAGRNIILVPDSAHGTNPATSAMAGMKVVTIPSDSRGNVDLDALRKFIDEHGPELVGLMLTNPNTLGLFDENVEEVIRLVHEAGGLVYGDGANFNALLGIVKPGALGFDVMHYNLHKTFSTPHGGGGPGAGPVGVSARLADYLPGPVAAREDDRYTWRMPERSIGRVKTFYGNFGVLVRALAYILAHGGPGLRNATVDAVLNAVYIRKKLEPYYELPFPSPNMHEVVFSDARQAARGVRTGDIAKRLIDYGFHPYTVSFPLIVHGALMIEPTETESKAELDAFIDAMIAIAGEVEQDPELVRGAPHHTRIARVDEVAAARRPVLRWKPPASGAAR